MQAYLLEFVNFMLRWLHVIAAIAWIGESIYFVMLDNGLRKPKAAEDRDKGVFGEMWAVHGGGFYHNQKYATAPAKLPEDLHWSFWKSYTTWLSGFALFVLLYMTNPGFYLVNPNSSWEWAANLSGWQANVLALVFLLAGWVIYNELCKRISPNMDRDGILSLAVAVLMVVVAYLSVQMFSGRAAFLLTGAVMATAMSANVFFWIIPGQRRMVKAMKAGEEPNPLDGKRGKQRSVHNTYFTLPVVLLMISNHYSFVYNHEYAWVLMALFIFAGALIRQFFVLMHTGKIQPLDAIGPALAERGVALHTDAVQAFGRAPLRLDTWQVGALALSAHKFNGPKGVGVLVLRRDLPAQPVLHGGGQERGVRSGTLNAAGIVGCGAAAELTASTMDTEVPRLRVLRDQLLDGLLSVGDAALNGSADRRLPHNAHVAVNGCDGEALLLALDAAGIAASTGSACQSGAAEPSHVLTAIGADPDVAHLRLTCGRTTTAADVDRAVAAFTDAVKRLRDAGGGFLQ